MYRKEARKLAEAPDEEPFPNRLFLRSLDSEIDRDAEERVSKPIVRRGLGSDDPP